MWVYIEFFYCDSVVDLKQQKVPAKLTGSVADRLCLCPAVGVACESSLVCKHLA